MEAVSETASAKGKKKQARSNLYGFTPSTIVTRLDNFRKYPPAGNWRHIGKIKILHAYLLQTYSQKDNKFTETYIIPFRMLQALEKLQSHVKDYYSFEVLPERVKSKLHISSEFFKKEDINLVVTHQGNLNYKIFDHVYCSICKRKKSNASQKM